MSIKPPYAEDIANPVYEFSYTMCLDATPTGVSNFESDVEKAIRPDIEVDFWNYTYFINPVQGHPVRVQDFLQDLDLSGIVPVLDDLYKNEKHFKFSPEAVLRTMIYWKLKGYKFLSDVHKDLLTDPTLADSLGFDTIPDYKQLYHFLSYRLSREGTKGIFDAFLKEIIKQCEWHGIPFGEEVLLDSTPLEAKPKDPDATYSGHYKKRGYKWHNLRCEKTLVPIDYHVSTITEYDGYLFAPLMLRARMHGVRPEKVYIDCSYASFENLARMKLLFGDIDIVSNIAHDWVYRVDGTREEIEHWYEKLWKSDLYQTGADFEYKQLLLMMTNDGEDTIRHESVGAMYRNDILARYEEMPDSYLDDYHVRNRIEHIHGLDKLQTNLKNINGKGIEKFTAHVGMHIISIMAVALCRLQNGIIEGLVNLGGLI